MKNEEFLAVNRHTAFGHFAVVHITPSQENDQVFHNNGDRYRVTINTGDNGGQDLEFYGRESSYVSFVITGPEELREICSLLAEAHLAMTIALGGEK